MEEINDFSVISIVKVFTFLIFSCLGFCYQSIIYMLCLIYACIFTIIGAFIFICLVYIFMIERSHRNYEELS